MTEIAPIPSPAENLKSSRIPGFAKMTTKERLQALTERGILHPQQAATFVNSGALPLEIAENFIENCVGGFSLPLGIATNFLVDGKELLIPMAVEESSVIAAASFGAKLARSGGGFTSEPAECIATCQIQFTTAENFPLEENFKRAAPQLLKIAEDCHPRLSMRGGGVVGMELRILKPGYNVIHLHLDTREAMGANIVNTVAEEVGRRLEQFIDCKVGLKILTNLTLQRVTKVNCIVAKEVLETQGFSGSEVVDRICAAWEFADLDPFRATTHNKGVMNGIDPIVIATGNDWRAVEAGCHAFASVTGKYKPLTRWWKNSDGDLQGKIEVPIAVGTVGGVTNLHPTALGALKLLGNPPSKELACIMAAVGLAQNLSALRALGCEGIQKGHMSLHDKNLEMMRKYDHLPSFTSVPNVSK